ncbi:MAG: DNA internalization-related competence protein ComEC/Rec2 [Clostridia bacterium]|nr:DNA internalization-related competence protein ComEC/Rec2 [Clostridia bacterium]
MKRLFLISGLTLLTTIILCETLGYYGYNRFPIIIASVLSAVAGALLIISVIPDVDFPLNIKHFTVAIFTSVILGSLLWTIYDVSYSDTIAKRLATDSNVFTVGSSVNVKTSKGYLSTVICDETNANISLLTTEKLRAFPDDKIIADIKCSVDRSRLLYNKSSGIHLSGEVTGKITVIENDRFSFYRLLYTLRNQIKLHINTETGEESGFLNALILGDKSGLSFEDKSTLQLAGIYHICAVSGLHVSIMCMFVGYIIDFLNINKSKPRFFVTVPILFILLGITGFSVSAIRAVFMASCALLGRVFLRRTDSLNFLGLILSLILIISPSSAFSPSLLLSFMATMGIILLANPMQKWITTCVFIKTGKIIPDLLSFFLGIFCVSVAATTFTAVVSVYFFSTVSLCGLLANIIALPLVTVVYILTVVMLFFSFLPFCGSITLLFAQLVKIGVKLIMNIASWFTESVFAKTDLSMNAIGSCALLALVAALLYLYKNRKKPKKKRKQRVAFSGVIFALVFVVSLFGGTAVKSVADPDDQLYHVAFIDVGQGMSSVISYGDSAVIIDCGGSKTVSSAITDYLHSKSIKNIKSVILSHLHSDHCNAFVSLLDDWDVPEVIIPYTEGDPGVYLEILEAVYEEEADLVVIEKDTVRTIGNMSLFILTNHLDPENSDQNDNSLVVISDYSGTFRALFSGDITEISEKKLVSSYGDFLDCKVLGVAHHGSKYSSSEIFLDEVSPLLSIISVGKNSYGHPSSEAIDRLLDCGSTIMTTLDYGTIEIVTDGVNMDVLCGE